ncbi:hypothetical protein ACHAW5_007368 [Stephanodiscus triporus]|uniref:Uncharacterized protein n=1 Tax=Stephanodiscus triporus TaxID=2934178 RepID=A0ABD3NTB2_9STRA
MFSLGRGGRSNDTAQGGRNDGMDQGGRGDGNSDPMGTQRRTSSGFTDWDDTSVRLQGDDPSAPDVGARFARGGEQPGLQTTSSHLGGGGDAITTPHATAWQPNRHGKSHSSRNGQHLMRGAMT